MIRGTDAEFKFNMPCSCSDIASITISFWQPENSGPSTDRPLPIIKVLQQCLITEQNQLSVVLDREETLRFSDKRKAFVQFRATMKNGVTFASKKKMITVYPINDESLIDNTLPTPTHDYVLLDGQNVSADSDDVVKTLDGYEVI